MSNNIIYPWFESYWKQFQSQRHQSRLPHALMLRSVEGLGTEQLAAQMANNLLCQNVGQNDLYCGNCSDCHLIAAATHPDLHKINVAEDKKYISVDQIRDFVKICHERPHQGGYRIAIVEPAHSMTIAAANALLKTLEEPGADTLIILVMNSAYALPATVRSRCQLMHIDSPSEVNGHDWIMQNHHYDTAQITLALRLSLQAPLKALNMLSSDLLDVRKNLISGMSLIIEEKLDPLKLIGKLGKFNLIHCIDWMYSLGLDAEKFKHQVTSDKLVNADSVELIKMMSVNQGNKIKDWIDQITEARRLLSTSSNINPQLIVEDLMFRWIAIFK